MGRRIVLMLATLASVGCARSPAPDPVEYALTIPDDIPGDVVLKDKEGVEHAVNGRELYASSHRAGWQTCWQEYQRGRVGAGDDAAWERYVPGDFVIAARGFVDGFKQRHALLPR